MKRMHMHIAVKELSSSIQFYSTLFGCAPSVQKEDYAKWRLSDPQVNFALSINNKKAGLDHIGIEVDTEEELAVISTALADAEIEASEEHAASCCYANSHKHWTLDPQEIAWEAFVSYGESDKNCAGGVELVDGSVNCCIPTTLGKTKGHEDEGACCIPNPDSDCCG